MKAAIQHKNGDPTSPDVRGIVTPTRQGQLLSAARKAISPLRETIAGSTRRDGEEHKDATV